jgi:hypothetical protein
MPTNAEISLNPSSVKGDIVSHDGSSRVRIPVGANGTILVSQSTSTSGIEYKSFSGDTGQRVYLISSGSLTAATTWEISNIPQNYSDLFLIFSAVSTTGDDSSAGPQISVSINTSSTSLLTSMVVEKKGTSTGSNLQIAVGQGTSTSNLVALSGLGGSGAGYLNSFNFHTSQVHIPFYSSTSKRKMIVGYRNSGGNTNSSRLASQMGEFVVGSNITAAITSIKFTATTHNINSGKFQLYGIRNGDI